MNELRKSSYSNDTGGNCVEVGMNWHKSSYSGATNECVEVAMTWHTSSYSNASGGECVEVAVDWRKSTYSNSVGGNCVEVAELPAAALLRDTQHRDGGHLVFPTPEWAAFLRAAKAGRL